MRTGRLLKKHEILASWFDKLTMRFKPLKSLGLILSLSKDGA